MSPDSGQRKDWWEYYDKRAREGVRTVGHALSYWTGLGVKTTAGEIQEEGRAVQRTLRSLESTTFVEVGAGPGTFTADLPGVGVAVDQSEGALKVLRSVLADVAVVRADAFCLPLRNRAVRRVFASHLYGLLTPTERLALLREARRVADELVVLDAGRPVGVPKEHWQRRTISGDGEYRIFRRHFLADELAEELSGTVLYSGRFYVVVHSTWATT